MAKRASFDAMNNHIVPVHPDAVTRKLLNAGAQGAKKRLFAVQFRAELAGKAKDHNLARGQGDAFVRMGVATPAGFFGIGFKLAEAADKQGLVFFDGLFADAQQRFNNIFDFATVAFSLFVDGVDNFSFGQRFSVHISSRRLLAMFANGHGHRLHGRMVGVRDVRPMDQAVSFKTRNDVPVAVEYNLP